ncbi:MAG: hypothetical protein KatS3mg124_1275 [Porticoccaceae bacterium]|nr:MAG: hypothetical protein KatS3mg124_1275 [Porticoccaceae bacterium]
MRVCEELFAAARSEFKHMEHFYFHNMLYEYVWKDNRLRHQERTSTAELLHRYGPDYRVILVGDASMAPYEITAVGGCIEYHNAEPGAVWLKRLVATWRHLVWLNPVPEEEWDRTRSIGMVRQLVEGAMFPLTLAGLEGAMERLVH